MFQTCCICGRAMCRSFLIVALAQYFVQRCRGLDLKTLEIFGFGWVWIDCASLFTSIYGSFIDFIHGASSVATPGQKGRPA